jgi:hypothetical protein
MKWSEFQESWLMGSDDKNNVVFFDARAPDQVVMNPLEVKRVLKLGVAAKGFPYQN